MNRLKFYAAMFAVIIGLLSTFTQTARAESWSRENLFSFGSSENAVVDCTTNPVVTNIGDTGAGTLRQAVIDACAGSTITFSSAVTGTINQWGGQIMIDKNLTIEGPGAGVLTIRSLGGFGPTNRIFSVNQYTTVAISGLSMTDSYSSGIMNWGGNLTVTNSSLSGNIGGGIVAFTNSITTISNSTVSGNSGGINNSGIMTIANSTVSDNRADENGGAGITNRGTLTVTSSTISGNYGYEATVEGGGLYNNGTATVTNSTISNNSLTRSYEPSEPTGGAGIGNGGGTLTLINSTVANNSINTSTLNGAIGLGPGIHQRGGTVIVRNSIIAGNTSTRRTQQGPFIPSVLETQGKDFQGTMTSEGYNLLGDNGLTNTPGSNAGFLNWTTITGDTTGNIVGTSINPIDARLAPLADNGGPTLTRALLADSPAINAGNTATSPATDQRGAARVGTADIGAFEFGNSNPTPTPTPTVTPTPTPTVTPTPTPTPNTPPTIEAATGITRQQGSALSNSQIAGVNDTESGTGGVTFSITSVNPSNGVTVSNIVNTNGTITADIIASCSATDASFTLQASDGSLSATATLNVAVTANTAPTLGYNNASVGYGGSTTTNPSIAPGDNGSVSSIAVLSAGTYTGMISVGGAGVVSIGNAANAGTHTITIRATDNCGATTDASFTLTVNKATLTVTADNQTTTYGDADPSFAFGYAGFVSPDTASAIDTPPTCTVAGAHTNAGSYPIVCAGGADNNYNFSYTNGTLTVNKAALTVTANNKSKTYGQENPAFTASYSAFASGDTASSLGGTLSFNTTATTASPAGTYPVTPSGLTSSNYNLTFAGGTLTVNKANLTVTADDKSKIYSQANPAFTASFAGFVNGDTTSSLGGTLSFSTTATTSSAVGTYPIIPSGLTSSNYNLTFTNGTLTINKATLTVTADNKIKTYGQSDPAFTFAYAGFVSPDTASVIDTPPTCTVSVAHINVGSYPITCAGGADNNYNFSYVNGTLQINKAALTVTAENKSNQYSDPLPSLTYLITGFVGGDTISVVSGSPVLTTTAMQFSAPGSYSINIVAGTLSAANYTFNLAGSSLTVTQEDARAYYTGSLFVNTTCATCSTATVTLAATIKDITAETSDLSYDPNAGDIRNASVTFINRDTNTPIATVPINLVSAADTKVGTAVFNWNVNIGSADSSQYTVGIVIGNYYDRNSADDNEVITVSKPIGTNFITGGGFIVLTNSVGQYEGTVGTKTNFGFNVKYGNGNKNLKGNVNVIVRSGGRVLQIKGNAMLTLTVNNSNPSARTAIYTGKTNITDITDPNVPISLGGNNTLQMEITDQGEPGSTDSIAITLWDGSGLLLFSSNWNGTQTAKQTLGGGNLVIR